MTDRHICGLFSCEDWLRLMAEIGFQASSVPFEHSEIEAGTCDVFIGLRPLSASQIAEAESLAELGQP